MVDFNHVLTDIYGSPLREPRNPGAENSSADLVDVTLARIVANAALVHFQGENVPGAEHVRRFALATRIAQGGEITLPAEDIAFLKDRLAKSYPPLVAGQAIMLLDPGVK